MNIELYELKNLCRDMAELGAANLMKQLEPAKDSMSQREAYRLFGEARIKNWVRHGLLSGQERCGTTKRSKILYSRAEVMAVMQSERLSKIVNRPQQNKNTNP